MLFEDKHKRASTFTCLALKCKTIEWNVKKEWTWNYHKKNIWINSEVMHIFFAETNDKQENISHTAPRVHRCIRFSLHINMNNQKYIGLKWIRNSSNTKSLKLANFSANYSYLGLRLFSFYT